MHLGVGEIALLIVLALVLFGAKRLPQVGRAAGEAIREFKSAFSGGGKVTDEVTHIDGISKSDAEIDAEKQTDDEENGSKL
ncbi:Sec-independent protein translocase protein TatA [Spirochaetia bacterium]|nr:Sec-independent protein translocase protein TatA [Spirochaetia bacterium]